jgi:membrane fusion protein (multidrug efflux system)
MKRRLREAAVAGRAALVLIFALAISCKSKGGGAGGDAEQEAKPVVAAQTIVVTPQPFTETLGAIGTVSPRPGHVAAPSAPAPGRVANVDVAVGQSVQAGQPLIELEQQTFEAARQSADAALAAAEKNAERQERLAKDGIVPPKDAEAARAEAEKARADAMAARRAEQLATIRSPIKGVVTRLSTTLGASVDPSQPLVEVSDPLAVDVLLSVTPTDAARVRPGMRVTLSAGQGAGGEALGFGSVAEIAGTVDTTTRSVEIRVRAPSTRRELRIGETVFGSIAVVTRPHAIVVPSDAVVPEGDGFKVFVVDSGGIAHEQAVKIGSRSASGVEILEGLSSGDRVVTFGAYGMEDSAKVVPLNAGKTAGKDTTGKPDTADKP